jgi:GAF domain-containing protein/HAMP domain-containing protein
MGLIAFTAALFLTNRIIQPVDELTQTASRIAAGDQEQMIHIRRRDEIGILAQSFNDMTYQLRNLIDTLEERIQRRTQLLQTSAEVGRRISDILDLESLLLQVTNLIKERFNYYHVQVFLVDDDGYLVTRAGSGTIGAQMTAMSYQLEIGGESLVGRAGMGQLQLANDVSRNPHWLYNDFLPDTKAELSLPLRRGINTIGVLDVQSNRIDAFTDEDLTMLQSISDQLTIAVRNARLFQESEESRQQAEKVLTDLQKVSNDLARRSTQLHTAIEVSKAASPILDTRLLIQQVVNRRKDRLG